MSWHEPTEAQPEEVKKEADFLVLGQFFLVLGCFFWFWGDFFCFGAIFWGVVDIL